MIRNNVATLGFKTADIKIMLSSHAHFDHIEGHAVMQRRTGAQVMAMFHATKDSEQTRYSRYHLTDSEMIEVQELESHPILRTNTNRGMEKLFAGFSGTRFFLAKDNLYEVLITR